MTSENYSLPVVIDRRSEEAAVIVEVFTVSLECLIVLVFGLLSAYFLRRIRSASEYGSSVLCDVSEQRLHGYIPKKHGGQLQVVSKGEDGASGAVGGSLDGIYVPCDLVQRRQESMV